jgi:hypothetical protein
MSSHPFEEEYMKLKLSIAFVLILAVTLVSNAGASQPLFEPYTVFPISDTFAEAVGIGDFNSDGLNDVAMTSNTKLWVFLQKSDGSLDAPVAYDASSRTKSMAVGDLNNDDRADIVIAHPYPNTINIFFQLPDGTLAPRAVYPVSNTPDAVAVGDLNQDGLDDIAISHWNAPVIGVVTQTAEGTLNPIVTYPSPQAGYDDIAIGDVNGDGLNDVVKMNGQGINPDLSVYLQNSDGTLSSALSYYAGCSPSCAGSGVDLGDVSGDGRIDIVFSYGGNRPYSDIAVFTQAQDGSLLPAVSYPAHDIPEPVEVADVNSDGLADVITAHGGWSRVGVFLQQNGMLSPYSLYTIPYASHYWSQGLDVGDINSDGLPDLAIADSNHGLVVLYHTGPDITPPLITVTAINEDGTPYTADTWTNQTVIVKFTCSDDTEIASCPADQVFSAEGVTPLSTGTATDTAGNSATVTFGPIKVDKTPPVLLIGVSPNPVLLNGNAELMRNAVDELSGLQSGPCMNIDTHSVGMKSVTCWVSDLAGNSASTTVPYQVIYDFEGFLSPVIDCVNNPCDPYQISFYSAGSPVSLKFQLKDANGNFVQPVNAPLWLVPFKIESYPPVVFPENYPFQTTGSTYTWKKSQNLYVYDWSTKRLPARTVWTVGVKLDDGKTYYVFISLK